MLAPCHLVHLPATRLSPVVPLVLLGIMAASILVPSRAAAVRGRWTPTLDPMGSEAVHMVLVPGAGTEHSRVLWWPDGINGRIYAWNPANGDCSGAPLAGTTELSWNPGTNIFCSGHTQLSGAQGGQVLTVGGVSSPADWGLRDTRRYSVGPGAGTWTALTPHRWPRWYPSATTLRDSRVLVCSGNKGQQTWYFGGLRDGNPPASGSGDLLHRFGRAQDAGGPATGGYWEDPMTPLDVTGPPPNRPLAREGHTSAFVADRNAQAFFGGRDGSGNLVNDQAVVWLLRRTDGGTLDADYTYRWEKLNIVGQVPGPRREHTAVAISSTELLIFGGLKNVPGQGETPTDELWRLFK
ncbi:MAG: hypothetical protein ACREMG_14450, partial [Gemmatimonadales bacterium]